jgi:hypothetical protein
LCSKAKVWADADQADSWNGKTTNGVLNRDREMSLSAGQNGIELALWLD